MLSKSVSEIMSKYKHFSGNILSRATPRPCICTVLQQQHEGNGSCLERLRNLTVATGAYNVLQPAFLEKTSAELWSGAFEG